MAATAGHFLITVGFPPLSRLLDRRRGDPPVLHRNYFDGHGVLRTVLAACTDQGWALRRVEVDREAVDENGDRVAAVTELGGVRAARTGRDAGFDEG